MHKESRPRIIDGVGHVSIWTGIFIFCMSLKKIFRRFGNYKRLNLENTTLNNNWRFRAFVLSLLDTSFSRIFSAVNKFGLIIVYIGNFDPNNCLNMMSPGWFTLYKNKFCSNKLKHAIKITIITSNYGQINRRKL